MCSWGPHWVLVPLAQASSAWVMLAMPKHWRPVMERRGMLGWLVGQALVFFIASGCGWLFFAKGNPVGPGGCAVELAGIVGAKDTGGGFRAGPAMAADGADQKEQAPIPPPDPPPVFCFF